MHPITNNTRQSSIKKTNEIYLHLNGAMLILCSKRTQINMIWRWVWLNTLIYVLFIFVKKTVEKIYCFSPCIDERKKAEIIIFRLSRWNSVGTMCFQTTYLQYTAHCLRIERIKKKRHHIFAHRAMSFFSCYAILNGVFIIIVATASHQCMQYASSISSSSKTHNTFS